MISYPHRSSSSSLTSPASSTSDPATHRSVSIGPWPIKSESFRAKFQDHRHRNSVGPWPLKRCCRDNTQQQQPLQIFQDLHEVNVGGLPVALNAVDEECALNQDDAGHDRWRLTEVDNVRDSRLRSISKMADCYGSGTQGLLITTFWPLLYSPRSLSVILHISRMFLPCQSP
jgi:hypothetical protein